MSFALPLAFNQRSAPPLSGRKAGVQIYKVNLFGHLWTAAYAFSYSCLWRENAGSVFEEYMNWWEAS